jgi:uncharacterized membrane protein
VIAAVDWHTLLTTVWVSLAAGVGVTAAFGFAILGGTRATELRRDGHASAAALFGAIGVLGALAVVAAIAFGLIVIAR